MKFSRYCQDKWVSIFIFAVILFAGWGLLLLIETPIAVTCVIEGFYLAGLLLLFLHDFFSRKEFYDKLLEYAEDVDEIAYLSELITEPSFQEGQILYYILQKDEKYMNDRAASQEAELQEYKDYVEMWVHEIKTPIAVSRLIMENHRDEVTRSLSGEMNRIEKFIDQMLYYSKSSSLQDDYMIRAVSLKELVMSSVKEHAADMIAEKVTPKFEGLDIMVLTDLKWMRFVLGQIISNGVKYHSKERKPQLVFSAVRVGRKVCLSISDNGIGMPPEDVERVFRKGFTGNNGREYTKSTGIGLYLCDILCRKLGTKLSLTSVKGEGTVVSLEFLTAGEEGMKNITKM